jgi:acyl-CoA thioesterase-1
MPDKVFTKAAIASLSLFAANDSFPETVAASAKADPIRIVAFGDSLTAGFGLEAGEAFPARLQVALRRAGYDVTVVNAGISGDTSSGGLARVSRWVPAGTDLVIVELGANDILRGVPPRTTERNLDGVLAQVRAAGSEIILAGMIAPAGWGTEFSRSFDPIYQRLASRYSATLYPFFLKGVAGRKSLNLPDGLHPNEAGVVTIVENILPTVVRKLETMNEKRAGSL